MVIDQTAVDGWQSLGEIDFAMGGMQSIHLGDNTGEAEAQNVQLVFDAVRLTRVTDDGGDGSGSGSGSGDDTGDDMHHGGGCAAGGGAGGGLAIVLLGLVRRRRR